MTDTTPGDPVLDFVDRYLAYLIDSEDEPDLQELDATQRAAALERLRVLDILNATSAPQRPIEDDPVAKRFGFDHDDPTISISTSALKDAARTVDIPFSELANKLTNGGRPTETRELLRLAGSTTVEIDRDLAMRFAAILKTSLSALQAERRASGPMTFDDYLVLEEAHVLVESCARELSLPFADVQGRARELVGAAAFRNHSDDAWRTALSAALDRIRNEQRR